MNLVIFLSEIIENEQFSKEFSKSFRWNYRERTIPLKNLVNVLGEIIVSRRILKKFWRIEA